MISSARLWILILGLVLRFGPNHSFGQTGETYQFSDQIKAMAETDTNSWIYELMPTKYAFIGDYKNALAAFDRLDDVNHSDSTYRIFTSCKAIDAKDYIIQRSKREKVIMINEAHHQPLHRAFTASLLAGLWANGYRFLGLETIADGAALTKRKKLKISDGFYTAEPEFAKMVRLALKLGFTIFSYEATGKNGIAREQAQAENIMKVVKAHPESKFLIHCGFSHVTEANHSTWGKAMAGRFKDLSRIDPFTIDQVEMTERSEPKFEAEAFKNLSAARAIVMIDDSDLPCTLSDDRRLIDIKVVHPRTQYASGRPTWMRTDSTYQNVEVQKYFKTLSFPCLAIAYNDGEDDSYVPVDVVEIKNAEEIKPLFLPSGTYRLKIVNEGGAILTKKVVVP